MENTSSASYLIKTLHNTLSNLKDWEKLDCRSPAPNDCVVYIPIEGTYNKRFFARMYLLRNYSIEKCIISRFGYIQYQVPVCVHNIELILLLIGTHLGRPWYYFYSLELGDSLCKNFPDNVAERVSCISIISKIRQGIDDKDLEFLEISQKFHKEYLLLEAWIYKIYDKAFAAYLSDELYTPKIRWKSEYLLYQFVKLIYPDCIFQYQNNELSPQTLDIYIPSIRTGIEYQGEQHYKASAYFGGMNSFNEYAKRDLRKKDLCKTLGISLLYWNYSDKITMYSVIMFLRLNHIAATDVDVLNSLDALRQFPVKNIITSEAEDRKDSIVPPAAMPAQYEIRMYSLKGKYIKSFISYELASKETGISKKQIQRGCKGYAKTAGHYIWKKVSPTDPVDNLLINSESHCSGMPKAIYQVDSMGTVIHEYPSICMASRMTQINDKSIRDALNGRQKTAGGYTWVYKTITIQ